MIQIKKIEIDTVMKRTLDEYKCSTNGLTIINRSMIVGNTLQRMSQILLALNNNILLPPIIVKEHKLPNSCTYEIIDGRHRVVGNIINEKSIINAIILNN